MDSNMTENKNCGICQETATDASKTFVTLPCAVNHVFHPECITKWLGCGHTLAAEHIQPGNVIDSTVIAGPCRPNCGGPLLSRSDAEFMINHAHSFSRILMSFGFGEDREAEERRRDRERRELEESRRQAERLAYLQTFREHQAQRFQRELRELRELRDQLADDDLRALRDEFNENELRELRDTLDANVPVPRQQANHPAQAYMPDLMGAFLREVGDLLQFSVRGPAHSQAARPQQQQQNPLQGAVRGYVEQPPRPLPEKEETLLQEAFGPNVMQLPSLFADDEESDSGSFQHWGEMRAALAEIRQETIDNGETANDDDNLYNDS
ncbi:hypothetical protein PG993_002195 [Apiospora rasikravindrae]|uniref:RING-type domain-containing protein n=1 Tax=Apiospora rasikravindrae TaxID=990691 RepID=A0ABR1UDJ9_9PEZI